MWNSERTVIGWIVAFKAHPSDEGALWVMPDKNGNIRHGMSTLVGLDVDLPALSAVADRVKARHVVKKYGSKLSPLRGEFCTEFAAALNEAKLFPQRREAA